MKRVEFSNNQTVDNNEVVSPQECKKCGLCALCAVFTPVAYSLAAATATELTN